MSFPLHIFFARKTAESRRNIRGGNGMGKKLVAYFSATGTTREAAEKIAEYIGADTYEIVPEKAYSNADLDWMNKRARSTVEMKDPQSRPAIKEGNLDPKYYDEILLGFPIWWYVAPKIINTFLESYDFSGKKIVLFATSGGSGFGNTVRELQPSAPDAVITEGKVLTRASSGEIKKWMDTL